MEILEVIKCSLIITAIYACFWDGMIFGNIRAWMDERIPYMLRKPIYDCIICMSSLWGTSYYIIQFDFNLKNYIEFILQVAGLNVLILGIVYLAFNNNSIDIERNTNK